MIYRYCLIFLLILLQVQSWAQDFFIPTEPSVKHEVRGVWLTTLNGLDWPKTKATSATNREKQQKELCQILDQLQQCGINTVFLQTRIRGAVLYPSKIEPWDVAMTGSYNKHPGYDPLKYAIEETHKRGMELHAWVVTIPAFKTAVASKIGKNSLMRTNPGLLRKHNGSYYMDPGEPETAKYLTRICNEIVENYDVDGIHLDYIRYPENPNSFKDAATFKKYGKGKKKEHWRRENVDKIVKDIYEGVKSRKPWVRVSCSPVGKYKDVSRFSAKGWNAFDAVYQDAQGWLKDGIMDMLCPMMYFDGDHFYPFAADWQENTFGRTVVPGLGIYFMHPREKDWPWGVIQRQLCYLRQQGLQGQAYFRSQFLTDNTKGLYDYLKQDYYPHPALMPAMPWQHNKAPEAPKLTQRERVNGIHERICWEEVPNEGGSTCRYVIYASTSYPVDTENPRNIVDITWNTSYTYNLLSSTLHNLNLVLTAVDRYGNESEATPITLRKEAK